MTDNKDHNKPLFKLENHPKKNIYSVPDNYFDKLPGIIQSRVVKPVRRNIFSLSWLSAWQYALPVIAILATVGYFVISSGQNNDNILAMIDEVPTEELIDYLASSDLSTEEFLALVDIESLDLEEMVDENIELLNDSEWDNLLEEYPDLEDEI